MFVCCECCVLSDRGLCNELITHPDESYRLWCVVVYDLETSIIRRPWSNGGAVAPSEEKNPMSFETLLVFANAFHPIILRR